MNKVILKGRLTAKPELKKVGDEGIRVAEFSIAVDRRYDREKTDFINCQAWRKTGELIEKHFDKGKEILIIGELHIDKYTKDDETRYATRVVVDEFDFCGSKGDASAKEEESDEEEKPKKKAAKKVDVDVDDDDLPF